MFEKKAVKKSTFFPRNLTSLLQDIIETAGLALKHKFCRERQTAFTDR